MANNIVQLQDKSGDNIYPISGGTVQGAVTKGMLAEGVFEGPELSEPTDVAYVRTANIVDGAVTTDKIAAGAVTESEIYFTSLATSSVSPSSGYSLPSGTLATKKGGVVYFKKNLQVPAITSTDNQTNAFTLPSGFRPTEVINFVAFGGVGNIARVRIDTSGIVRVSKISSDIAANTYIGLSSVSYIAA